MNVTRNNQFAAGYDLKCEGGVLFSVRDTDKQELIPIADKFSRMGFEIYGTEGTASVLNRNMIATNVINKISEPEPNVLTLLESGKIHYVISTSANGRLPARDSVKMRRKAVERSICSVTAIDTARALANVLETTPASECLPVCRSGGRTSPRGLSWSRPRSSSDRYRAAHKGT